MLSKLFKYDFRAMGRLIVPISLLALAIALVGGVSIHGIKTVSDLNYGSLAEFAVKAMLSIIVLSAVLAVVAYSVLCFVVIFARFYKSFFTDEGYLTFTLPVKTHQLLFSKLFSSVLWWIAAAIVTLVLALFMISVASAPKGSFVNVGIIQEVARGISVALGDEFGVWMLIDTAVCQVIQWICMICMVFLSITIGSTVARKGKVIASVGFYFAINSAIETLFVIIIVSLGIIAESMDVTQLPAWIENITAQGIMNIIFGVISVLYAAAAAVQLVITNSILKKRLNLS